NIYIFSVLCFAYYYKTSIFVLKLILKQMKETISVSIASQPFIIDLDAYNRLRSYLNGIKSRTDSDTLEDVEDRIAQLFISYQPNRMMVINIVHVTKVIETIGTEDVFGPSRRESSNTYESASEKKPSSKITRSRSDRYIAGVCGGLAKNIDADASLVRIIALLLILFGGASILLYLILWIVIPYED
ncbi:MAG: PspC domain-containing protein, partial [Alistipes sp.]|nr:PspC domain-containing protein [Candidatus Alistipes equi]